MVFVFAAKKGADSMAKKRANGEGHIKTCLDAADKRGLLPMFYLELVSGLAEG